MSRTFHHGKNRERSIQVRGIRRQPVDLRRLARALIDLAEAEAAAQAEHEARQQKSNNNGGDDGEDRSTDSATSEGSGGGRAA